uniref:INO80 complex subunit B-like conserved region domain-containing protein n=1 Tax=Kalanchoe fedtschenkoi TaxID=63787 RepID=A0A7N0VJZ2_KALFE
MEGVGGSSLAGIGSGVTKKRSQPSRRPRTQAMVFSNYQSNWSVSSTPSDNMSKGSSEDNNDIDMNSRKKERTLNQCISNSSRMKSTDTFTEDDSKRCPIVIVDPVNRESSCTHTTRKVNGNGSSGQSGLISSDGPDSERKVRKVKLKLGGVTHTLHAKSQNDGASIGEPSLNQGNSDIGYSPAFDRGGGSPRIREKNMSLSDTNGRGKVIYKSKMTDDSVMENKFEAVRKSNRVPKRRIIDRSFEDGRYLDKLISSEVSGDNGLEYEDGEEGGNRKRSVSRALKRDTDRPHNFDARASQDSKSYRSGKSSDDIGYSDEEDIVSDEDLGGSKRKKARKFVDALGESRTELTVTTRQRALQTGKDILISGGSLIEFPNGLPPAPPRKQKEKTSEIEQQLKRAEALQKRRMQVEKANQELEAEAIRKILGQDSSRKKKENQIKKRQEELAQEKADNAMKLAPNVVRWTFGLNGIFVTFSEEMGLPSIFKQERPSYPPPREKCAGPSCPNKYKYRCSKTKLPLCSLQCYKAIQQMLQGD